MVYALLAGKRMSAETVLPYLIAAQGVLGAVDTLVNHELIEHLPRRAAVRPEVGLHSIREALYALLFVALAWFEWHGAAALVIAGLLAATIVVDAIDEWTENRVRVLPQNERVLHFALILNLGAISVLLGTTLLDWHAQPSGLILHERGWLSWLLTLLGLSAAGWSLRDFLAYRPPPLTNSSEARKTSRSFS